MEAVYLLGTGSPYQNEELRYSLRSLDTYAWGITRVILVGECPSWINRDSVEHIPFKEDGPKDYRIAAKILHICEEKIVTKPFLFCNDDFFFTKPFEAARYPFFYKGDLINEPPRTSYQHQLKFTKDYLMQKRLPTKHFDVHTPIIYDPVKFKALKEVWEYSKNTIGLVVKSTYANHYYLRGEIYSDIKLKEFVSEKNQQRVRSSNVFSIYDQAWKLGVFDYLNKQFTKKSRYEL
jgi:hypothetical protein